jgi:DNA helicase-2/ATP-dependent DNA helicase PcrA
LEGLNPQQLEAVQHTGGPLLVVAGAGSGKTRVLTHRIAHLIDTGIAPWRILAITFTNKAAGEMRNRVIGLVGPVAERMWLSTFHSACVRILRANADRLGYEGSFSIYDDVDSRRMIENILGDLGIDAKRFPPRAVQAVISQAKGELLDSLAYEARSYSIYERRIAEVFNSYERRMREANAMDFDDLLVLTARLFGEHGDVLERYQQRFVHVLVDEYQDTNHVQNELVLMLGREHRNVCVVGDSDQSIYRFRGADVRNILDFEHTFPEARTIVLDQNYRSTNRILAAANAVISNNALRKDKKLWSALGDGEPVRRYRAGDERDEATFISNEIASLHRGGKLRYGDVAVFFRTNAQSRPIESALADRGVRYRLVGGSAFYERREVKDLVSFLRTLANPNDELSLRRIVNVPKRGVGPTSVAKLASFAERERIGFGDALRAPAAAGLTGKSLAGVIEVVELLDDLRRRALLELPREYDEFGELIEVPARKGVGAEAQVVPEAPTWTARNAPSPGRGAGLEPPSSEGPSPEALNPEALNPQSGNVQLELLVWPPPPPPPPPEPAGAGPTGGGGGGGAGHSVTTEEALVPAEELLGPAELIAEILDRTGYRALLEADGTMDAQSRLENIAELAGAAAEHQDLATFLESTALVAATDELVDDETMVSLMTLHTAKGLEFPTVFLTGLEEDLFPHSRSLADPDDIEEERRLCYVGITRAKERLYLTHTWVRTVFGATRDSIPSRFLKEIPDELVEDVGYGATIGSGRVVDRFDRFARYAAGADAGADEEYGESGGRRGRRSGQGDEGRRRYRRPAGDYPSTGAEGLGLVPGDRIVHTRWGEGTIVEVRGEGEKAEATIRFAGRGDKQFLLSATPLKRA